MKSVWSEIDRCPIGTDGVPEVVGHITSRDQAERWQAAGYDVAGAVDRYAALIKKWEAAHSEDVADAMMREFYDQESRRAVKSGVTADDPDFWRFATAPKRHEWA